METWNVQPNELFDKLQDLFAWWGQPSCARAFVECVDNEINRVFSWDPKHVLKALCNCAVTWLFRARSVGGITMSKDIEERLGLIAELDNERRNQCVGVLFPLILEIKKKVGYVSGSCF